MTTVGAPRVLILSLRNWFGAVRLPKAFQRAGFDVATLSFPGLLLSRCRFTRAHLLLPDSGSDEELIAALRAALVAERPSIVIPTDEASVELLQLLAATLRRELPEAHPLLGLLRDSLGEFSKHAVLRQRCGLARAAAELGVRAPAYCVVRDRDEARAFAAQHGFPVVLKAEQSFAGLGVAICADEAALDAAVGRLEGNKPRLLSEGAVLQAFIPGRTTMRAVAAWRGEVVAGLSAIKLETHPGSTGPSTVVQFIAHQEMQATAQAMIRALGFSGFASLDYILDADGAAHLIEMNSRPTPICHLGEYLGFDLCLSLRRAIEGEASADGDPAGLPKKVTLFPQEWVRDANSPHFNDSYHDVPWDEPDLLESFISLARGQMRWNQWEKQEARRERLRASLTRLDAQPALAAQA